CLRQTGLREGEHLPTTRAGEAREQSSATKSVRRSAICDQVSESYLVPLGGGCRSFASSSGRDCNPGRCDASGQRADWGTGIERVTIAASATWRIDMVGG